MKDGKTWLALGGFLLACFVVAALGGAVTGPAVKEWYPLLRRPPWTPPAWVFGPVWTVLYLMMAVAAWMVWRKPGSGVALIWFWGQLILNCAWSFLFFGLRNPAAGLVDIALLWGAIVGTTAAFWKVTPVAGWLFMPYLGWVSYAMILNFALWKLNS